MAIGADQHLVGDRHAGAEEYVGLDGDIAAQHGVVAEEHRFGRDQARALVHRPHAPGRLPARLGPCKFSAAVDPGHLVCAGFNHHHPVAPRNRIGGNIGEVIFTLRVVVANGFEQRPHVVRMGDDQARIAQVTGALGVIRVLVFDHFADCTVTVRNDPAIGERIGWTEAEHRNLRPALQRGEQAAHGIGLNHRAIAKAYQHQPAEIRQRRLRLQRRMGGAQLRLLQSHRHIAPRQRRAKLFVPITRHHHRAGQRRLRQAIEQVQQHRLARDGVQHLVQIAFHPGALARGKDDGGKWRCGRVGHESPCKQTRPCQQMLAV